MTDRGGGGSSKATDARAPIRRRAAAVQVAAGACATAVLAVVGVWLMTSGPTQKTVEQPTAPETPQATTTTPEPETPTVQPTTTRTATKPPQALPTTDPLAGDVPDSVIQQLLDRAEPTTLPPAIAATTRAVAWRALSADLKAGGWTKPHLQASAVTAPGADQTTPAVVDVTTIWAATRPPQDRLDRQRSTVRLIRVNNTWSVDRIS